MQRITITIEDDLLAEIDAAAEARGYQNRSEVIRDLARAGLQQDAEETPSGQCVAALVYVYDHAARDLSKRLHFSRSASDRLRISTPRLRKAPMRAARETSRSLASCFIDTPDR